MDRKDASRLAPKHDPESSEGEPQTSVKPTDSVPAFIWLVGDKHDIGAQFEPGDGEFFPGG